MALRNGTVLPAPLTLYLMAFWFTAPLSFRHEEHGDH